MGSPDKHQRQGEADVPHDRYTAASDADHNSSPRSYSDARTASVDVPLAMAPPATPDQPAQVQAYNGGQVSMLSWLLVLHRIWWS